MAVYDLRKRTKASSGQRHVIDAVAEPVCSCSKKIEDLELKIRQLETIILRGTIENGRDKNISNISK